MTPLEHLQSVLSQIDRLVLQADVDNCSERSAERGLGTARVARYATRRAGLRELRKTAIAWYEQTTGQLFVDDVPV